MCLCLSCTDTIRKDTALTLDFYRYFRYVCEKCGNKRCPHHLNHIFKCTNSNELNQEGVIDVDN